MNLLRAGRHTILILVASCASVVGAATQQPRDGRTSSLPAGSASVSGVVLTDDPASVPIRRATVTLRAPDAVLNRAVITDETGRFTFSNIAAGTYGIDAAKPPYVASSYGARRPGRPGTTFLLSTGQRMADMTIRMPAGAVITGTVSDTYGNPASSVQVSVVPAMAASSALTASSLTAVVADDRGVYRAFGLLPGDYLVFATPDRSSGSSEMTPMSASTVDAALLALSKRSRASGTGAPPPSTAPPAAWPSKAPTYGYAALFFPGTLSMAEATRIAVKAGEERSGVDFSLTPVATAALEGVVTMGGQPVSGVQMVINSTSPRPHTPFMAGVTPALSVPPQRDGRFKYTGLAPGTYTVLARTSPGRGTGSTTMAWASAEIVVSGEDLTGMALDLQPGMSVSGRVVLDSAAQPAEGGPVAVPNLSQMQVRLIDEHASGSMSMNGTVMGTVPIPPAPVRPDGSFVVTDVLPGTYRVSMALGAASGWALRSAVVAARDALDASFTVEPGVDIAGAVVTLSNRHTELSGTLEDAAGRPAPEYFVVVFPTAASLWRQGPSRRVQSSRPSLDGHFVLRDLPAGNYLIAALVDVEPGDLGDPAFLAQLVPSAIAFTLADGETRTQDLHLAGK